MVTSLAQALTDTGMIPPTSISELALPSSKDKKDPVAPDDKPEPVAQRRAMQQFSEDDSRVQAAEADRDKFTKEGRPAFPTLAPEPKPEENNDPIKGYISAIGVLGAIGSMFTRTPLTYAMNAASGALTAMKSQDESLFKQKYEVWKTSNENAMKLFDYQNNVYKDILNTKNKSVDERIAELKANAAAFKDDLMMKLTEDRNPSVIAEHLSKADEAMAKMEGTINKIQDSFDKKQLLEDGLNAFKTEHPNATPKQLSDEAIRLSKEVGLAGGKGGSSAAATVTYSPEAIDKFADAVRAGVKLSALGLGYGTNANKTAVMNKLAEKYPDFNMAEAELDYQGRAQEARTGHVTAAKIKFAVNSLDRSLPLLENAMRKVDLTQFKSLNALENYAKSHSGDKDLQSLLTAIRTTSTDYSNLISRTGTATDSTRAAADELVNINLAKGQMQGFIDQVRKEKDAQLAASQDTLRQNKPLDASENKEQPSQEDLEHTAKIHGITVEEVKKKLGIQ